MSLREILNMEQTENRQMSTGTVPNKSNIERTKEIDTVTSGSEVKMKQMHGNNKSKKTKGI